MGKMSREKGKRGEREVAKLIKAFGFADARRGQQYNGLDGDDVVGLPGFHVEVKRVEHFQLWKALEQAGNDARQGDEPIVFHRKNGKPWVVVMYADTFLGLVGSNEQVPA